MTKGGFERTRRLNVSALFIAPLCHLERSAQTSCTTCKPEAETRDLEACLITVSGICFWFNPQRFLISAAGCLWMQTAKSLRSKWQRGLRMTQYAAAFFKHFTLYFLPACHFQCAFFVQKLLLYKKRDIIFGLGVKSICRYIISFHCHFETGIVSYIGIVHFKSLTWRLCPSGLIPMMPSFFNLDYSFWLASIYRPLCAS
jgi:hypothetical protein